MRSIFTLFLLTISVSMFAQETKKMVFLEHFTNTRCGICANKNPAFFDLIQQYPDDVIHVAYHHPFPYTNCELYLYDKDGNSARSSYYSFSGSPRLAMNGSAVPVGGALLSQSSLDAAVSEMSTVSVSLDMVNDGTNLNSQVKIENLSLATAGEYRLFVMVIEKELAYNAPNGEDVHYDVFRAYASDLAGDIVDMSISNQTLNYSVGIPVNTEMDQLEMIAFVQNMDTGDMMNAGSSAAGLTSTQKIITEDLFKVFPNPASDMIRIDLNNSAEVMDLKIINIEGKALYQENINTSKSISLDFLSSGMYFIKMETEAQIQNTKLIVE